MGDFIKDLNIIDFLGMLLPGAFVALCLSIQHPGAWQILETAIGCELSLSLRITVVLVVGYVIGMLLHRVGGQDGEVPVARSRPEPPPVCRSYDEALEARGRECRPDNPMGRNIFPHISKKREIRVERVENVCFLPLVVAAVITVLLVAAHMLPLEWGAILGIALAVVLYVTDVYMLRDRFPTDSGDEGYTIKAMRRVLEGDAEYYFPRQTGQGIPAKAEFV